MCNEIKELNEDELDIVTGGRTAVATDSNVNPSNALKGLAAGVNVVSCNPGPGLWVLIASKTKAFIPVVLLGSAGLKDINPEDIENISVLK